MLKAYHGTIGSQIHYRELGQGEALVLLPPSPHSGLYFEKVMPYLSVGVRVIAPDYPGFGGSDNLTTEPSIEAYAHRLAPFLRSLGSVHVMGFHTGNLVALELALTEPDVIEKCVMVDIPFFDFKTRAEYSEKMKHPALLPSNINDLGQGFDVNVRGRIDDLGPERAYDIWAESLRAGTGKNAAFRAAFAYDCDERLGAFKRDVTVIATKSGLLEPTRRAAGALSGAALIERPDIDGAVFEKYAPGVADEIIRAVS